MAKIIVNGQNYEQMIVESVQTLVEHQARPQETSRRMSLVDLGKRLLEVAKRGDTEAVRALMSNGAPFTTDWLGSSPLHFAAQHGHLETAEVLLRAGISRDARTKVDRTPLHTACQEGHAGIVQLLLQSNADVDAKDMLKMTPLHWSTEKGHIPIIGILIRHGADITQEDKFNRTPMDIALANGRTDIAQLLQIHQHTSGVIDDGDTITIEAPETLVTETVSTTDDGLVIDTDKLIKSEPDDGGDQSSTSVLATLAALAEATAPNSSTATSEAMSWLESQGITMISTDGSLITSAVESGQTITLTEAGKIALNQFIQQEADIETDDGMAAVTSDQVEMTSEDIGDSMVDHDKVTADDLDVEGDEQEEEVTGIMQIVRADDEVEVERIVDDDDSRILVDNIIHDAGHVPSPHLTEEDSRALIIEENNPSLSAAGLDQQTTDVTTELTLDEQLEEVERETQKIVEEHESVDPDDLDEDEEEEDKDEKS